MRYRFSKKAECELDEIFVYWARRAGLEVADKLVDSIEERFALLGEFPNLGRKCSEVAPGVLSFPAGKYLIYYRMTGEAVLILHIFHGAGDQARALVPNQMQ